MSAGRVNMQADSGSSSIPMEAIPLRHTGRNIFAAIVLILMVVFLVQMFTNPRYGWDVVLEYLFAPSILTGAWRTIQLTFYAMLFGIVLGIILAVLRTSENVVLASLSSLYIWFFRGVPLLVQIIFWYNISALYPVIALGVPFGPDIYRLDVNSLITPWMAAVLALSLHEGAYMAEIVRGGLLSVDAGQTEAAKSLGMPRSMTLRRIILPQAMRAIVPPTGNQFISMLKTTSLISVLALPELLYSAQIIYSRNYQVIPLLLVATIWYLVMTTLLSIVQRQIEGHFSRS